MHDDLQWPASAHARLRRHLVYRAWEDADFRAELSRSRGAAIRKDVRSWTRARQIPEADVQRLLGDAPMLGEGLHVPRHADTYAAGDHDFVAFWEQTFDAQRPEALDAQPLPTHGADLSSLTDPQRPLPFEEVFLEDIAAATSRLAEGCPEGWECLAATARLQLQRGLLRLLTNLHAQPLQMRFTLFVDQHTQDPDVPHASSPGREVYDAFIARLVRDELQEVQLDYPELLRLSELAARRWQVANIEMLQRLHTDAEILSDAFASRGALGHVMSLETDLSDPHDGGRVVTRLDFSEGTSIVYKPRDVGIESAYNALLGWLNDNGLQPALHNAATLPRGAYGWCQMIVSHPCETKDDARLYFERAGMLAALLATLHASDCHRSNLVACGSQPVLIDTETLLQPAALASQRETTANAPPTDVLRVLLLPVQETHALGSYDISGLGGVSRQPTDYRVPVWDHPQTNAARLHYRPAMLKRQANAVHLDGVTQNAAHYAANILEGYGAMHVFLRRHREKLIADDGPLAEIQRQARRILVRSTRDYAHRLNDSLQCRNLRTTRHRTEAIGSLRKHGVTALQSPNLSDVVSREIRDLTDLDVPRFVSRLSRPDDAAYESVLQRIRGLDEKDLQQQLSRIRVALASSIVSP